MSGITLLQHGLTGISLGGAYALIAIGYTMVYGILRLINFAHGDIFMMAGYFMIFAVASMPWYLAIPLVMFLTVLLGVTIERVAYKPLRSAPRMSIMICCRTWPLISLPHCPGAIRRYRFSREVFIWENCRLLWSPSSPLF
jgi:branched-subunit amino acid ABC-type transport system permease component